MRENSATGPEGRTFQAKGIVGAMALRQKQAGGARAEGEWQRWSQGQKGTGGRELSKCLVSYVMSLAFTLSETGSYWEGLSRKVS